MMNLRTNRRVGFFYVSDLYNDEKFFDDFPVVLAHLRIVPTRVDYLYERAAFEYRAYSPFFDELKNGEKIPVYDVIIIRDEHGEFDNATVRRRIE